MSIPFLAYISFGVLALLNVITGVFVEAAVQSAAVDKEMSTLNALLSMFQQADSSHDGKLTMREFHSYTLDETWKGKLKDLDIDLDEVQKLFSLLDIEGDGEIEVDEFVGGCMQLRGPAKAANLAQLLYFVKALSHHMSLSLDALHEEVGDMQSSFYELKEDTEILKSRQGATQGAKSNVDDNSQTASRRVQRRGAGSVLTGSIAGGSIAEERPETAESFIN